MSSTLTSFSTVGHWNFFDHSHYLFHENRILNERQLILQEGTPKIILVFQIGLRLKIVFCACEKDMSVDARF
jgi:hypothetical protein